MLKAVREHVYNEHCGQNTPQFTVRPGEIFEAETELCTGGWLVDASSVYSKENITGANPAVVVAVEGAVPGGSLLVTLHDIIPDGIGYTGFLHRENPLANTIIDRDWGDNIRIVHIDGGDIRFSPSLAIPAAPMLGVLGTAPAGDKIPNSHGGRHGGNMDAQEVCAGASVLLPVEVPGALLHLGDAHAIQGDGELCGAGGVECRATVRLSVQNVPRPARNGCIRIENSSALCAVCCEGDIDECCVKAARELIYWLADGYGMDEREAYLLLGQVMELRVTQLVNPTRTVIAKIGKSFITGHTR